MNQVLVNFLTSTVFPDPWTKPASKFASLGNLFQNADGHYSKLLVRVYDLLSRWFSDCDFEPVPVQELIGYNLLLLLENFGSYENKFPKLFTKYCTAQPHDHFIESAFLARNARSQSVERLVKLLEVKALQSPWAKEHEDTALSLLQTPLQLAKLLLLWFPFFSHSKWNVFLALLVRLLRPNASSFTDKTPNYESLLWKWLDSPLTDEICQDLLLKPLTDQTPPQHLRCTNALANLTLEWSLPSALYLEEALTWETRLLVLMSPSKINNVDHWWPKYFKLLDTFTSSPPLPVQLLWDLTHSGREKVQRRRVTQGKGLPLILGSHFTHWLSAKDRQKLHSLLLPNLTVISTLTPDSLHDLDLYLGNLVRLLARDASTDKSVQSLCIDFETHSLQRQSRVIVRCKKHLQVNIALQSPSPTPSKPKTRLVEKPAPQSEPQPPSPKKPKEQQQQPQPAPPPPDSPIAQLDYTPVQSPQQPDSYNNTLPFFSSQAPTANNTMEGDLEFFLNMEPVNVELNNDD